MGQNQRHVRRDTTKYSWTFLHATIQQLDKAAAYGGGSPSHLGVCGDSSEDHSEGRERTNVPAKSWWAYASREQALRKHPCLSTFHRCPPTLPSRKVHVLNSWKEHSIEDMQPPVPIFHRNAYKCQERAFTGGTKNVNPCTATVGNLSKTVASLWLTLLRQQRVDFCKYIFLLCALAVKLIHGAFVTTAQEEDAQRAGDSGWLPTATDLESLSPAGLTFGTRERRNWKFGRLCRVSVGMKRCLNDS